MDYLFLGTHGHVSAIDRDTGREVWRVSLPSTGYQIVSLIVDGERLFAASKGYLFCLDVGTGDILWKNSMPGLGHSHVYIAVQGVDTTGVGLLAQVQAQQNAN